MPKSDWELTRPFFRSFIASLVGTRSQVETIDGQKVLCLKLVRPDTQQAVEEAFFGIFSDDWMAANRPHGANAKNIHPLAQIIEWTMAHYLECVIGTFSWVCEAGATFLLKRPRTISGLRDSSLFHATLFELDILTYLFLSGAKITPDYGTTGGKDVEALVELSGQRFFVECKILDEGKESRQLRDSIMNLSHPFQSKVRLSGAFKQFPNQEDLEQIKNAFSKAEKACASSQLETTRYAINLTYGNGGGIGELRMPEPDDSRVKDTMDKALSKIRHSKLPALLFIKVEMGAGLGNAGRKSMALFNDKKYRKISQLFIVNKIKRWDRGFDLEVYEIPNPNAEWPTALHWQREERRFKWRS